MLENRYFLFLSNFMKIIHIKLPHKRRELTMLKIFGENLILKQLLVFNNKADSSFSPLNNMWILFFLKYAVSLHNKIGYLLLTMKPLLASKLAIGIAFSHFFLLYVHTHRLLLRHYKYIIGGVAHPNCLER